MSSLQGENYSIIREIKTAEDALKTCYERIDKLEIKLKRNVLHPEQQESIRKELTEAKKLLATNEDNLKKLQRQNMKTFAVAAAFCFICFMIYCLYVLVAGPSY